MVNVEDLGRDGMLYAADIWDNGGRCGQCVVIGTQWDALTDVWLQQLDLW